MFRKGSALIGVKPKVSISKTTIENSDDDILTGSAQKDDGDNPFNSNWARQKENTNKHEEKADKMRNLFFH